MSRAGSDVRFHVEVNRVDGSADIAKQEIAEFSETVRVAPESEAKQEVLDHLDRTKFIVANQVPTGAFVAKDYDALGYFCEFYIDHAGGMVQADREGFYRGKKPRRRSGPDVDKSIVGRPP